MHAPTMPALLTSRGDRAELAVDGREQPLDVGALRHVGADRDRLALPSRILAASASAGPFDRT